MRSRIFLISTIASFFILAVNLYLCLTGFDWVVGLVIVIIILVSVASLFFFRARLFIPQAIGILCYFLILKGLGNHVERKWANQFSHLKDIPDIQIIKDGEHEEDWSSGGYTYIKYFVFLSNTDLGKATLEIKDKINPEELSFREHFLPIRPKGISKAEMSLNYLSPLKTEEIFGSANELKRVGGKYSERYLLEFIFRVETSD